MEIRDYRSSDCACLAELFYQTVHAVNAKDYQRQGIATALCERMERAFDVDKITTHASITARTFFMCRGYMVVREQRVMRRGITLTNFVMEKEISR